MKILVANKFHFMNGGSETVCFQERAFLKTKGVQVIDFSMHHPSNLPSDQSAYFVRGRSYREERGVASKAMDAFELLHSREAVRNITSLIEKERPDILHCHNIYHQLTPSIIGAASRFGVKTVLTLHDYKVICPTYVRFRDGSLCSDCAEGKFINVIRHRCSSGSLGKSALLFAEAKLHQGLSSYDKLNRVVAPSKFMLDSVSKWRFKGRHVILNYNGVDPDSFSVSNSDEGYILYLGRLSSEKGLLTLGRAQQLSGVPVRVAGTGPLMESLQRQYPGLELLGHQSGDALKKLIEGAAAVVVPSEWYENCPMSVLEAMASGKAVVGSRIGGIPELVEDEVTGSLFQPGDAEGLANKLASMLSRPAVRAQFGAEARMRVETKFSLSRHNEALFEMYESML